MKKISLLMVLMIIALFLYNSQKSFSQSSNDGTAYGKVIKIVGEKSNTELQRTMGGNQTIQTVIVKITSGKLQGRNVKIENQLTSNPIYDIRVKKGDNVVLTIDKNQENYDYYISDIQRFPLALILSGLSLFILILFLGIKGIKLVFSLVLSFLLLYFFSIKVFLQDLPLILTYFAVILSVLLIFAFTTGLTLKTLKSALSTIISLIFEGFLLIIIFKIANISGNWNETGSELYSRAANLDMFHLTIFAFLIVSTGILMDISSSVTTGINELRQNKKENSYFLLLRESFEITKEKLGARINTLFFFFLGINLPMLILLNNVAFMKVINFQSLFLALGTFLSALITVIFCAFISCILGSITLGKITNKAEQS